MNTTCENKIIDVEPNVGYVTFRRSDDVIVFVTPSLHRNCLEFSYSNHPHALPVVIHRDVLAGFFARNPHIAAAIDNPAAF